MSTEAPDDMLEQARRCLEQDNKDEALSLVNTILKDCERLDAHHLRLDILLPDVKKPEMLRCSLDALSEHEPDSYADRLSHLEDALYKRLNQLQNLISRSRSQGRARSYLETLDDLMIFSDLFPAIHVARGLAYREAAGLNPSQRDSSESPLSALDMILKDFPGSSSDSSSQKKSDTWTDEWLSTAAESLETATAELDTEHPKLGETYQLLGSLYRETDRFVKALRAYQCASDRGRDVDEALNDLMQEMTAETQSLILKRVDVLLAREHFDEAADLLHSYCPQPVPEAWSLRLAELALLQNNTADALRYYRELLPGVMPDSDRTDDSA
jgi:tetratricopeptide (TPR) repeat protein